jgi:ClpP class serine protease
MLQGAELALCSEHGAGLLNAVLPKAAMTEQAITIESGQRYAIARGMAVVPVRGLLTPNAYRLEKYLGWTTYHGLADTMAELSANEDVATIVLEIDSPGGMVLGAEAAVEAIKAAAAVKPVYALVHPLAASAAYWLASQATEISLTPGSWVGSVGTMVQTSTPVQAGLDGDQWFHLLSSNARAKLPNPSTDEGRALIQQRLDKSEAQFHADIAVGRGFSIEDLVVRLSLTDDVKDGGSTYAGTDALERGLVDHLETRAEFFNRVMPASAPARRSASRAFGAMAKAAQARAQL